VEVEVRLAEPARDAAGVAEIYRSAVEGSVASFETTAPDMDEISRRMRNVLQRAPWLVAVAGNEVLGYAYAGIHRERAAYRWSVDVSAYVREAHQGKGIGRSLYDRLLPMLRSQGFANAYAGITLPNPASVALHESVGWKHGAWHDVAWYGMRLGEPERSANGEPREPASVSAPG
jgi:L-amino acid N-acyltransferase YncA